MPEWPDSTAIQNCIEWNLTEAARALADAGNTKLRVPSNATKEVNGDKVQLTVDEYRAQRFRDADRLHTNVTNLRNMLP